jgi:DNA-binding CsgD family transcriptional regulator
MEPTGEISAHSLRLCDRPADISSMATGAQKARQVRESDPLTARELEVLALVALGEPTAAMASKLGITENTIKTHLAHVYRETGSRNRVQAARHYLERYGEQTGTA